MARTLSAARKATSASEHVCRSLKASFFGSGIFFLLMIVLLPNIWVFSLIGSVLLFILLSYTFIHMPHYSSLKSERIIEMEIVSAIRFLILELHSDRSLYEALLSTSKNFAIIGLYLEEVIHKVQLGRTLEDALNEAVELCPSPHLRNVYWQLLNSLQTGADITDSLHTLLEDIVEEQKIRVAEYGRELNALSLFYMMVSIIIPTIGFTIITAIVTFIGIEIRLEFLLTFWFILSAIQYFFLTLTANRRPAVEAY